MNNLLLLGCLLAPQGDPLTKFLKVEGVLDRVPVVAHDAGDNPQGELLRAGPGASSLAAALLLPPQGTPRPDALEIIQQGAVLFRGEGHPAPVVRGRTVEQIEEFFVRSHRRVRKAVGTEMNFLRTVPELHGLMDRVLADEDSAARTRDDRKLIERQLGQARKADLTALHREALAVVAMAFELQAHRAALLKKPRKKPRTDVTGEILFDKEFAFGRIVVGGPGRNTYQASQIAVIIDLGGDDEYNGPAGGAHETRQYAVCIDLAGDDLYRTGSGGLGSATFGLGVCVDLEGDDRYEADARSLGFGAAGVGVFVDAAGNDVTTCGAMSAGVGLVGIGQCIDLTGEDEITGARSCFGIGLHQGLGHFVDVVGNDLRKLSSSRGIPELTFGAARGLVERGLAGGLGVFVDLHGDDRYDGARLSCGFGDLGGVGILFDVAGDDVFSCGAMSLGTGRRGGIGMLFDIAGSDRYLASEGMGAAGARGAGFFEDREGDDILELTGPGMGYAMADGFAVFQVLGGKNRFRFTEATPKFLLGAKGGLGVFRSLGKADRFTPPEHAPGPKGRREESEAHLRLVLNR